MKACSDRERKPDARILKAAHDWTKKASDGCHSLMTRYACLLP